jgi:ribosome-binding factor A
MALSHRTERVAEQIREEVSQILSTEVADPGIGLVTVSRVKVTPDLSLARIYWTIIGDDAERRKTQKALGRAAAYVRHLLSTRMSLRRSPEVQFIYDRSVAAQERVEEILQQIKQEESTRDAGAPDDRDASTPDAPASGGIEASANTGGTGPSVDQRGTAPSDVEGAKRPDGREDRPDRD